jgi:hypothetical protein
LEGFPIKVRLERKQKMSEGEVREDGRIGNIRNPSLLDNRIGRNSLEALFWDWSLSEYL